VEGNRKAGQHPPTVVAPTEEEEEELTCCLYGISRLETFN